MLRKKKWGNDFSEVYLNGGNFSFLGHNFIPRSSYINVFQLFSLPTQWVTECTVWKNTEH